VSRGERLFALQPTFQRRPIMPFSSSVSPPHVHLGNTRALCPQGAIRFAVAAGLVATLALIVPRPLAAADDARGGACSNRSLRGDYGILISGIAPAGPDGQTEITVGTALRTYDGHGNFSQVDNVHGQITGAVVDRPGFGTYEVRADCSGTATLFLTDVPFPIVLSFVIVDGGEEVKEAVMSPPPALVTAIERRVGR
jgi:hypothetical protein